MAGRAPVPTGLSRYSRFATVVVSPTTQYGSFANPPTEDIAALYVGTTATVTVVGSDGVSVSFLGATAGTFLPISPLKITAAGAGLLACYW
jgi:hypothetical protein